MRPVITKKEHEHEVRMFKKINNEG